MLVLACLFVAVILNARVAFYFLQLLVAVNYLYIYIPVIIFLIYSRTIKSRLLPASTVAKKINHFLILVPAHNESGAIPFLLESISKQDYPRSHYRVIVIADNCADNTADVARSYGAASIERTTHARSSKGQCIAFACQELITTIAEDTYIVIVDADCELAGNFLTEANKQLNAHPSVRVMQTYRYVKNSTDTTIATLDAAAEMIRQLVALGSREILGLSGFLHGSGIIFERSAFFGTCNLADRSDTEDKEWNARLLENGLKITWCPAAQLAYKVYSKNNDFQAQRSRWIKGQFITARNYGFTALWQGIRRGNVSQIDFALFLFRLPRSVLMVLSVVFAVVSYAFFHLVMLSAIWMLLTISLLLYGLLGLWLTKTRLSYFNLLVAGIKVILGITFSSVVNLFSAKKSKWSPEERGKASD